MRRVLPVGLLVAAFGMALASRAGSVAALALSYRVLASIGFGTASGVAASMAATRWFARHRGLAFGLIETGFGAGQLAFARGALLGLLRPRLRRAIAGPALAAALSFGLPRPRPGQPPRTLAHPEMASGPRRPDAPLGSRA